MKAFITMVSNGIWTGFFVVAAPELSPPRTGGTTRRCGSGLSLPPGFPAAALETEANILVLRGGHYLHRTQSSAMAEGINALLKQTRS